MRRRLILSALLGLCLAFAGQPAICDGYDCTNNPEWCDNDSYCLGPCRCDLSTNSCRADP